MSDYDDPMNDDEWDLATAETLALEFRLLKGRVPALEKERDAALARVRELEAELGRYRAFVSHERLILAHANPFELPDGTISHHALDDDQRARLKRINDFLMGLRIEATGRGGDGGND